MAPRERVSNGRKAWVTPYVPKRLTARCCSSTARSLEIVVQAHAGIVDEDVERLDFLDGRLNLRRVGHVQGQRRDTTICVG